MSFIYKIAKEKMLDGTLGNLKTATIKAALATAVPLETDTSLPANTGTTITLTVDQTSTGGVFGASAATFPAHITGSLVYGVVIYKSGTPNIPIAYIDKGVGLPQVLDGTTTPIALSLIHI